MPIRDERWTDLSRLIDEGAPGVAAVIDDIEGFKDAV
jgi:hypothetical protein